MRACVLGRRDYRQLGRAENRKNSMIPIGFSDFQHFSPSCRDYKRRVTGCPIPQVALNLSRRRPPSPEQTPDPAGA
jgi:hypothetical protein